MVHSDRNKSDNNLWREMNGPAYRGTVLGVASHSSKQTTPYKILLSTFLTSTKDIDKSRFAPIKINSIKICERKFVKCAATLRLLSL